MMRLRKMFTCSSVVLALACVEAGLAEEVAPLRILMIGGGCCHDYEGQKTILSEGIASRAKVEFVTSVEGKGKNDTNSAYAKEDWWKGFDAVLHNECYGGIKDVAYIERITQAHKAGLAGVTLHCSTHSYRHAATDEWRKFLGVTSMKHGAKGGIKLEFTEADHPVLKGISPFTTKEGELYTISKVWENTTVLAKGTRVNSQDTQPVMWVNTYGTGKMFGTTLGHHNTTMSRDDFLDIVTRGLMWSCGKLADDGSILKPYRVEPK